MEITQRRRQRDKRRESRLIDSIDDNRVANEEFSTDKHIPIVSTTLVTSLDINQDHAVLLDWRIVVGFTFISVIILYLF